MHLHDFTKIPETLEHLTDYVESKGGRRVAAPKMTEQQQGLFDSTSSGLSNIRIRPLNHYVLLKYLEEKRGISRNLARQYLHLVWYDNKKHKDLFAIGWANDSGAFELRAAGASTFKSVTGKKDITTFVNGTDKAFVFESMLDYLSVLMWKQQPIFEGMVYVLNSTAMVNRLIPHLKGRGFSAIHLFMDNDRAGQEAFEKIFSACPEKSKCVKHSFYEAFEDVNEWWVAKKNS